MHTQRRTNDIFRDDTRNTALNLHVHVVLIALAVALLFVFMEVTQAGRARFWTGGSWRDWVDVALGFGLYAIVLGATTEGIALTLYRALRSPANVDYIAFVSGILVAMAVRWAMLWHAGILGSHWHLFALLPFGIALCILFRGSGLGSVAGFCGVAIAALVSAIALIPLVTGMLLTYPYRGALSTAVPWGGFAVVMLGGLALCAVAGRSEEHRLVRPAGVILLAVALPLALKAAPWFMPHQPRTPGNSVILITADSLRADICSVYGGDIPTPALERLAQTGVTFERCYAAAPWTVPSLCAIFSSKYPPGLTPGADDAQREREELSYHRLGTYFLDDDGKGFVERLQYDNKFQTGAFIGNLAVIYQDWMLKGFDEVKFLDTVTYAPRGHFDLLPVLQGLLVTQFPSLVRDRTMDSTEVLVAYAEDYITRHRDQQFFLWVHLMDPHTPYDPPAAYRGDLTDPSTGWQEFPPHPQESRVEFAENMSPAEIECARALYEAEVRYVDWAVGRIRRSALANNLQHRAIICFSSDHGEELYERGRYGHGYSMYDEVTRVPLIFGGVLPPHFGDRNPDTPVSTIDLLPTLAEMLHVPARPEWRGQSLVPLMCPPLEPEPDHEPSAPEPVFAQSTHHFRYRPEPMQMLVDWPWKLIRGLESGDKELYNLEQDPGESTNRAEAESEITAGLTADLAEWSGTFPISFQQYLNREGAGDLGEVPADLREIFENQGYLGDTKKTPDDVPEP